MPSSSTMTTLFCWAISSTFNTSLIVQLGGHVKVSSRGFMASLASKSAAAFLFKSLTTGLLKARTMSRVERTPQKRPSGSCTSTWWQAHSPPRALDTMRSATSASVSDCFTVSFWSSGARAMPPCNQVCTLRLGKTPSK